jgi:AraC-like DNA-binding protein
MSTPYLCQDVLDDAKNALGCGVSLEKLAAQVGVSEDELRRLLGLPQ